MARSPHARAPLAGLLRRGVRAHGTMPSQANAPVSQKSRGWALKTLDAEADAAVDRPDVGIDAADLADRASLGEAAERRAADVDVVRAGRRAPVDVVRMVV